MTGTRASTLQRFAAASEWRALGCLIRLVVTDPAKLPAARSLLIDQLDALDRACSRFRDDSELSRLDAANGRWMTASPLLITAIAAALDASEDTDGAVDPTLGASMAAIGYDRDFFDIVDSTVPIRVIRPAAEAWRQIDIDPLTTSIRVPAGVRLDLGATAKALGADLAAETLAEALGCGVLVGLGGDIAMAGDALDKAGWPVRVQDVTTRTVEPAPESSQVISIDRGGLATSSLSARRWARGDRLVHHILDPRSGAPIETPWRTVSVVASSCLAANVASTAAVVKGRTATDWLSSRGLPARLVTHDGAVVTTPGWPAES